MGAFSVLAVTLLGVGFCVQSALARRGPPPYVMQPLSHLELDEIRAFATNAYRNNNQVSGYNIHR
jgi:hypothetical protein